MSARLTDPGAQTARHTVTAAAAPETVYDLLAAAEYWPVAFTPTIHVEVLERTESAERLQIWALAGDTVKTWTSRRDLDRAGLRIGFAQEVPQAPIAAMSGAWVLARTPTGAAELVLEHSYRAAGDDPEQLAWITRVTDQNSRAELANIKALAESAANRAEFVLSFEDTVEVAGSAADAYEFLYRAQQWPARLPHVSRMQLAEDRPGIQVMEMDTVTAAGDRHTTKSVRICFDGERIVYKQTVLPPLLAAHTGQWRITPAPETGGVAVSSQHTVVIRPESVARILGAGATVQDAREFARRALSGNSQITLEHAKQFAETAGAKQ